VKNILFLFLLLFSYSCSQISSTNVSNESIECPVVFYASEHRNYLKSEEKFITLDNLSYKAEINNYAFNEECFMTKGLYTFPLGVLFLIDPINVVSSEVSLPFYVALLDSSDQLIEIQYFSINGIIKKSEDNEKYVETEITELFDIISSNDTPVSTFVLGFMIGKKQKELSN